MAFFFLIYIAVLIFVIIVPLWKIFEKAGKPGWACIVPIYNVILQLEIIKKPVWWLVMLFILGVNIVFAVLMSIELAKVFGKDTGFAIGLIFLPVVFLPILGYGDARYIYHEQPE